nr:high-affinity branched-chain amino acid transport ATP-binding protein BraF [Bradyrhizobium sp. DOA9]
MGERHPRQRGHAGQDAVAARRHRPARQSDLLLPLPCRSRADHRRHAQSAAFADRPRLRRDPRLRDGGAQHGRQCRALQGEVVRDLGGDHRLCRRAVRAQALVHLARDVHAAALDRVHHRDPDRRHLQPARRRSGGDLHRDDRSVPHLSEGRHARHHRRHCRDIRRWPGHRGKHPVERRGVRIAQRAEGRDLRHHHRVVRLVRAARALRPLAEDKTLLPAVPALQARHLQAAEDLREVGAQPMSYFRAENLSLHFGGLKAVDAVSFAVEKGEILSIIGPNGAGKSSIFNLISRIYRPTSGRIFFEDQDITEQPPYDIAKLGIARTFQNIELFENSTVLSNLLVGRHRHSSTQLWQELLFLPSVRANEKVHRRRVEQVIEFLDLEPYRDKLISGLPYGVRKVIELARALCSEPKLILLDEPSSGLNVEETDDMSFWIRDMKSELGVTVLMVEHDMSLVNRVSDRVIALNYGRVLAMGSPAEVQQHPDVVAAYLGA